MNDDIERRTLPWMTLGFDWDGLAVAAAAFLAALLLGWIWAPLFWIGFAATILALAAARWAQRTPPDIADAILAPCDGRVVTIEDVEPPPELRLSARVMKRVRISSSPFATNKVYAPMAGSITALDLKQGEAAAPVAIRHDAEGLTRAMITVESGREQAGLMLASGGLGPRIELTAEANDIIRLGRTLATRRLGGWCELYLPRGVALRIWPGQMLTGGETLIGRLTPDADDGLFEEDKARATRREAAPPPADDEPPANLDEAADSLEDEPYPEPDEVSSPEDPAAIFARLREAARKHGESD